MGSRKVGLQEKEKYEAGDNPVFLLGYFWPK